jgi:hypothetical protein
MNLRTEIDDGLMMSWRLDPEVRRQPLGRGGGARAGFTPLRNSAILANVDLFQGLLPTLTSNTVALETGFESSGEPPDARQPP